LGTRNPNVTPKGERPREKGGGRDAVDYRGRRERVFFSLTEKGGEPSPPLCINPRFGRQQGKKKEGKGGGGKGRFRHEQVC